MHYGRGPPERSCVGSTTNEEPTHFSPRGVSYRGPIGALPISLNCCVRFWRELSWKVTLSQSRRG
jgi:hypothetical protein